MKLTPVVVLVDDESMTRLRPLLDELAARFVARNKDVAWERTMLLNGWTAEMIAWSLVIATASLLDLEVTT
jgi:hypothetical protein